ncbi:MAG: hypothetical protein RLY31_2494 [Bacteroidota bacterium]|jgi:uncharacterized membrane protein
MNYPALQALLVLALPFVFLRFFRDTRAADWLSPVVMCYLSGILLRNLTALAWDDTWSMNYAQGAVLLAIPLLLYSTDLPGWLKLARGTILGFGLMALSVLASAMVAAVLFHGSTDQDTAVLSAMLAGVFIGGTPNLNMIGIAMEADGPTIVQLNAAEIACGGLYLLFLTSVAHRFFGIFLPSFHQRHPAGTQLVNPEPMKAFSWRGVLAGLVLTVLILSSSAGVVWLIWGDLEQTTALVLLISTMGVGASFVPAVRHWGGTYEAGEYLLLCFSVAIGLTADFSLIWRDGWFMVVYCGVVLLGAVVLHASLCRLFRIDRDTAIITSTAGIYGPAFIGQVASVIRNRYMVFSGISTALVGLSVANFLGVLSGKVLQYLLEQ